jgi:hypothetical protein
MIIKFIRFVIEFLFGKPATGDNIITNQMGLKTTYPRGGKPDINSWYNEIYIKARH